MSEFSYICVIDVVTQKTQRVRLGDDKILFTLYTHTIYIVHPRWIHLTVSASIIKKI